MGADKYHYYVEGENERRLVEILSKSKYKKFNVIKPGKIEVFNIVEKEIKSTHILNLKKDTGVIFIFDTDTENRVILDRNKKFLERYKKIKDVILIPQVLNLEDELIRSCKINKITDLFGSRSRKEFKSDFNKIDNLSERLVRVEFDFKKLWRERACGVFEGIKSDLGKIEIQ